MNQMFQKIKKIIGRILSPKFGSVKTFLNVFCSSYGMVLDEGIIASLASLFINVRVCQFHKRWQEGIMPSAK